MIMVSGWPGGGSALVGGRVRRQGEDCPSGGPGRTVPTAAASAAPTPPPRRARGADVPACLDWSAHPALVAHRCHQRFFGRCFRRFSRVLRGCLLAAILVLRRA